MANMGNMGNKTNTMGSMGGQIGPDLKNTVLSFMRELSKKNKMINKKDIYTVL